MKSFVYLTVLDGEIENTITNLLINNKYKIAAAYTDIGVCYSKLTKDCLGCSLAYDVEDKFEKWEDCYKNLYNLIKNSKTEYINLIITQHNSIFADSSTQKIDRPLIDKLFKKFPKLASLF